MTETTLPRQALIEWRSALHAAEQADRTGTEQEMVDAWREEQKAYDRWCDVADEHGLCLDCGVPSPQGQALCDLHRPR